MLAQGHAELTAAVVVGGVVGGRHGENASRLLADRRQYEGGDGQVPARPLPGGQHGPGRVQHRQVLGGEEDPGVGPGDVGASVAVGAEELVEILLAQAHAVIGRGRAGQNAREGQVVRGPDLPPHGVRQVGHDSRPAEGIGDGDPREVAQDPFELGQKGVLAPHVPQARVSRGDRLGG